jgi:hypothetical protein
VVKAVPYVLGRGTLDKQIRGLRERTLHSTSECGGVGGFLPIIKLQLYERASPLVRHTFTGRECKSTLDLNTAVRFIDWVVQARAFVD